MYRIVNVSLGGDTTRVVERPVQAAPLSKAQQDSVDAVERRVEQMMRGEPIPSPIFPTAIPPLRWFVADDEGRLWVCATGNDPCTELEVFDPSGAFIATVALEQPVVDLPRPVIQGGQLHAVVEAEFGIHQLFVGRIVTDGR